MAENLWCELKLLVPREKAELAAEIFREEGTGGVVYDDPDILNSRPLDCDEVIGEELAGSLPDEYGVRAYFPVDDCLGRRVLAIKEQLTIILNEVPAIELKQLREDDWAEAWKAYYKPERIGKIVIKPSWEEYPANLGEIVVELDPGMAFGTGTHPTTRLCLQALPELIKKGATVLDLGTGSGILAVAAAKLGATEVVAADIDAVAVRVARENAARNGVLERLKIVQSDLLRGLEPGTFDLTVANIIAATILELIPEVKNYLKPAGIFLASGIIAEKLAAVEERLHANGFQVRNVLTEDGWCAVIAVNLA